MTPALEPGDHVAAVRRTPVLGDIVVFAAPSGMIMIKRVAGVAGDEVVVRDGVVHRNGVAGGEVLDTPGGGTWVVGPDEVFVLSDARHLTLADSRTFGAVPVDSIIGTVVFRYLPLTRVGRVR